MHSKLRQKPVRLLEHADFGPLDQADRWSPEMRSMSSKVNQRMFHKHFMWGPQWQTQPLRADTATTEMDGDAKYKINKLHRSVLAVEETKEMVYVVNIELYQRKCEKLTSTLCSIHCQLTISQVVAYLIIYLDIWHTQQELPSWRLKCKYKVFVIHKLYVITTQISKPVNQNYMYNYTYDIHK